MKGLKQNDKKKISRNEGKEDVCEFRQKKKAKGSQVVRCNWG